MTSRYRLLMCLALAGFVAACHTPNDYRNDSANAALLQTLRECLIDLSLGGERGKDYVSPCVGRDVSTLKNISRDRMIDALGPPRLCVTQTDVNFPAKNDCPNDQNPVWSFYRHAGSIDMGGGAELVCIANKQPKCASLEWQRTK